MLVKYISAAYLVWMGLGLLRAAWARWRGLAQVTPMAPEADGSRPFRTALLISLMNPKAILFFMSFFVQFVDPAYPHSVLSFAILGAIAQLCSAAYLSPLIFWWRLPRTAIPPPLGRHHRRRGRIVHRLRGQAGRCLGRLILPRYSRLVLTAGLARITQQLPFRLGIRLCSVDCRVWAQHGIFASRLQSRGYPKFCVNGASVKSWAFSPRTG